MLLKNVDTGNTRVYLFKQNLIDGDIVSEVDAKNNWCDGGEKW